MSAFPPSPAVRHRSGSFQRKLRRIARNWELYLFLIPTIAYFLIFRYYPMYGIQIAFRNFKSTKGILGSQWVGLRNFERFFSATDFWQLLNNTLSVSIGTLLCSFPVPILLALFLNQLPSKRYKKIVQTVIYAPHFISTMVICGMLRIFLSPSGGLINLIAGTKIDFLTEASAFRTIYVASGIWQEAGWGTIIYLATLSSIDASLYEAAKVDGASVFQRILHIDIPCLLPMIILQLIMSASGIMNVGFEKAYLLQTDLNRATSDIIAIYVYEQGIVSARYELGTAVGLFNTAINIVLLVIVNRIAKKFGDVNFV